MARRSTAAADLVALPWWVSIALAGLTYAAATFVLPTLTFTNPAFKAMAGAAIALAPLVTFLLIVLGGASAVRRAVLSRKRARLLARQTDIESVRGLSWDDFERLVGEAFRQQDYRVVENETKGADRGIDLRLARDGEKTLVQCKHWTSNAIGVSTVRELLGVTVSEGATRGILVCSGKFTRSAQAFADQNDIELIDGETLVALAGISPRDPTVDVVKLKPDATACPTCGAEMVKRTARKGRNAGQSFLGCSNYPGCRGIPTIEDSSPRPNCPTESRTKRSGQRDRTGVSKLVMKTLLNTTSLAPSWIP